MATECRLSVTRRVHCRRSDSPRCRCRFVVQVHRRWRCWIILFDTRHFGGPLPPKHQQPQLIETIPGTHETLATTNSSDNDDDNDKPGSPSHSLTSSPADSALHTPPSNADIDGPEQSVNVVGHNTAMAGVSASITGYGSSSGSHSLILIKMAAGRAPIVVDEIPSITATNASGVAVPVNAKLANGGSVFAEQAVW